MSPKKISLLVASLAFSSQLSTSLMSEELPAEYFARPASFKNAELSPDSQKIAYLCSFKNIQDGVWGVFSQSLVDDEIKSGWTLSDYEDVDTFSWVNSGHVGYNFWSNAINGQALVVGKFGNRYANAKPIYDEPITILKTALNQPYFYGLTTYLEEDGTKKTGVAKFSDEDFLEGIYGVQDPDRVNDAIADYSGTIRLISVTESGQRKWIYRSSETAEWERLPLNGYTAILGFNADTDQFFVVDAQNQETQGIYLYNPHNQTFEGEILRDKHFDLASSKLIVDNATGSILGVNYDSYYPKTQLFSQDLAQVQQIINQNIPGNINRVIGADLEKQMFFIEAISDKHPIDYYMLDLANAKLQQVVVGASWVDASKMASTAVVQYVNREGTKLFGYYTKTTKKSASNTPTVVIVDGHFWARANWGWDPLAQFLANRGYNVIVLNTRGTSGLGWRVSNSHGNILNMASDVEDAVQFLHTKGMIKGDVAIMGNDFAAAIAAYEAYKSPELFKCAIAANGVYDFEAFVDSDRSGSREFKDALFNVKGANYRAFAKAISPINNEIKVPMHISYGCHQCLGNDGDASPLIRRAKKSGVEVEIYNQGSWRERLWTGEYGTEYYESLIGFLEDVMPVE